MTAPLHRGLLQSMYDSLTVTLLVVPQFEFPRLPAHLTAPSSSASCSSALEDRRDPGSTTDQFRPSFGQMLTGRDQAIKERAGPYIELTFAGGMAFRKQRRVALPARIVTRRDGRTTGPPDRSGCERGRRAKFGAAGNEAGSAPFPEHRFREPATDIARRMLAPISARRRSARPSSRPGSGRLTRRS